jgi:glycosyltransferase involved in cell wall biosynthesis
VKRSSVLLIVPCYNESKRIELAYFDQIRDISGVELLFVDDGSTDDTSEILVEYSKSGGAHFLALIQNFGKARAIKSGIEHLQNLEFKPDWVGFIDADQAFDLQTIREMIGVLPRVALYGIEAVYSSRVKLLGRNISRKSSRHYLSRVISTLFGFFWQTIPYDTQSGFKLYRYSNEFRYAVANIDFKTRWFFDIETHISLCKAYGRNLNGWEYPVLSWQDKQGSKVTKREKLRISYEILIVLCKIWSSRQLLSRGR